MFRGKKHKKVVIIQMNNWIPMKYQHPSMTSSPKIKFQFKDYLIMQMISNMKLMRSPMIYAHLKIRPPWFPQSNKKYHKWKRKSWLSRDNLWPLATNNLLEPKESQFPSVQRGRVLQNWTRLASKTSQARTFLLQSQTRYKRYRRKKNRMLTSPMLLKNRFSVKLIKMKTITIMKAWEYKSTLSIYAMMN